MQKNKKMNKKYNYFNQMNKIIKNIYPRDSLKMRYFSIKMTILIRNCRFIESLRQISRTAIIAN